MALAEALGVTLLKVAAFVAAHAAASAVARRALAAGAGRAHRLARALHPRGAGRSRSASPSAPPSWLRRVLRARRLLRRHRDEQVGAQPPAAAEALPLRDAFAVLFFVSVGMLFDPMQHPRRRSRCRCWPCLIIIVMVKSLAAVGIVLAVAAIRWRRP
jgi:hypothetical protein